MAVTEGSVAISGLQNVLNSKKSQTVQLKDADPKDLQLFIDKMAAPIKGKSAKYNSSKLCLVLILD